MKKLIITIFLGFASCAFSQVVIGDTQGTASNKTSVLLEFANTNNKGIILPYVRTLPASTEGSIILDATDATKARVKYYNGAWFDLSGQDADVTSALANQPTSSQVSEGVSAKTVIGDASTAPDGVLVLESSTKAMVLPIVDDVNNIPSPSPGMIVYVKGTITNPYKRLAVYNGSKWSFWKP